MNLFFTTEHGNAIWIWEAQQTKGRPTGRRVGKHVKEPSPVESKFMPFLMTVDTRDAVGSTVFRERTLGDDIVCTTPGRRPDCVFYSAAPAIFFPWYYAGHQLFSFRFSGVFGKVSIKNGKKTFEARFFGKPLCVPNKFDKKAYWTAAEFPPFWARIYLGYLQKIGEWSTPPNEIFIRRRCKYTIEACCTDHYGRNLFSMVNISIKLFLLRRSSCGNLSSRPSNHFV